MNIRLSYDERFNLKMNELRDTYSEEILKYNGISPDKLDINTYAKNFFSNEKAIADVSVDQNANVDDRSILSFEYEFPKSFYKLNAYYMVWQKMTENKKLGIKRANKALEFLINGSLKLHDSHYFLKSYCYAFSCGSIVEKGLPFVAKIRIRPPQHLSSYVNHVIQFVSYASNQIAGAVGLPDFLIYFDYFARRDLGEDYLTSNKKEIEQQLQSFIFSMNWPYRGSQSSFTNISIFDKIFLKYMFENVYYPDMTKPNLESIKKLQKFYAEYFVKLSEIQPFTFPINTANFYRPDDTLQIEDLEFLDFVSNLNCKTGVFNIYCGPLSALSTCCRLRSDLSKVKEYVNSFGAGGVQIGSSRVVTINLPRISYMSETLDDYRKNLEYTINLAQDILETHRALLTENIAKNKLPLYTHGFMRLEKQYMTLGFIGLNESVKAMGMDIRSEEGTKFALDIINKMNAMNEKRSREDHLIRNVEQVPGESAAVDLCKMDKILYPKLVKDKLYSNQFIPLWKNVDIVDRIHLQGIFDSHVNGGSICHLNIDSSITPEQMKHLIEYSCKEGCIYFAINFCLSRCTVCGKLYIGKFEKSPCHNASVEKFLRVVGFLVPVSSWIPERREEFNHRQFYSYPDLSEVKIPEDSPNAQIDEEVQIPA